MKNLMLVLAAAVSLTACGKSNNDATIQHQYRALPMSCGQAGQTAVSDVITFTGSQVTEGLCTADYTAVGTTLTFSNLTGNCTALPHFVNGPNVYFFTVNAETGVTSLAFQPSTDQVNGCSIAMNAIQ